MKRAMMGMMLALAGSAISCNSTGNASYTGTAVLSGTTDTNITGIVLLTEEANGLHIKARVSGAPLGRHGFHVHAQGSCADEGNAAGGHFNPSGVKHGYLPQDGLQAAHVGDMGNIDVGADGNGHVDVILPGVTLLNGPYAVNGRSIILHASSDDLHSQPTGAAGARIACGIITTQ